MKSEKIRKALAPIPRVSLSLEPTPIHKLEKISREFSSSLFCKRDDLTGFALGGNKTRKLDFLVADALEKKADTLVAVGANQSNFCRIAAAAGAAFGFEVHLVLGGKKPERPSGNLLLDSLFGAIVHHIDPPDWKNLDDKAKILMQDLSERGKKVYYLPIGGSTPIGCLGYVSAFAEILDYEEQCEERFDYIVHASSSIGTQSGLLVGKALASWPGIVLGMGVAGTTDGLTDEIYRLANETGGQLNVRIEKGDIHLDHSYMGKSYGEKTAACNDALRFFARTEGIVLDSVYTGKAAAGILDYLGRGFFKATERTLFLHTGGFVELFE